MISRIRAKRVLAQLLLIAGAVGALGIILLAGRFLMQYSTGADSASALHDVATLPADAAHLVRWDTDTWSGERQLEPANRTLIEAAYIRAWAALGNYQTTGSVAALTDTFTARARDTVLAVPPDGKVATWDLGHRLTVQFYALDGGTVALSDSDAALVRTVLAADHETVVLSHERYDVVMALVDGYWRIDQLRRGADSVVSTVRTEGSGDALRALVSQVPRSPVAVSEFVATEFRPDSWSSAMPPATATAATVGATGTSAAPVVSTTAATPQPWTPAEVATLGSQFARAADAGVTALRVPLNFNGLGGADPFDAVLTNLATLFDQAEEHHLMVIPVLFDGLTDLSPANWAGAERQLSEVVLTVRDSPALLAWDLVDGPESRKANGATDTEIRAFLVSGTTLLHGVDPATPVTISWHSAAGAADPAMVALVDFVSLQADALGTDELGPALGTVGAASDGRPVSVVTTGPASDGGWSPFPRSENRQAAATAARLAVDRQDATGRISVGALQDSTTMGRRGLFRADGSAKPVAALIAPNADLSSAPSAFGPTDVVGANFWRALLVVLVLTAAGLWWRRRRRAARPHTGRPGPPSAGPP